MVKFKHEKEDRLKGVKVGAVSVIPLYLGLIALAVFKAGAFVKFPVALYKTVHASFYSFIPVSYTHLLWNTCDFLLPTKLPLFLFDLPVPGLTLVMGISSGILPAAAEELPDDVR